MEAKKTVKIMFIFIFLAVLIFCLVLFLNSRIEAKDKIVPSDPISTTSDSGQAQSYLATNSPLIADGDFVVGQKGKVDLIVYEDYSDAFSADFAASLAQAKIDFGDNLRIAYRPFNVSKTELSAQAALAVICAADSGQGEIFRDKIFQAVRGQQFSQDQLLTLAEETGLNQTDFQTCLTNSEKKERIDKSTTEATNFSVYGAPTVFVNSEMLVGARPYDSFVDSNGDEIEGLKQVIERQLK